MGAPRLRCLTLNLWGIEPPVEERMDLVVEGLRTLDPDVVALQEVREGPGLPNQAEVLGQAAGYHAVFEPATPFGGGQEGLALLARQPFDEHAARALPGAQPDERRILLSARLGDLWVHTTHLNYRLQHGLVREQQVLAIDQRLQALQTLQTLQTFAPGERKAEVQILMGDFNARPEADEMRFLRGLHTLEGRRTHYQDAWDRLHPAGAGWTWAAANPYTARLSFLERDRRLDYIYVTPERRDGRGRIHDCRIVLDQPGPGGVFASDHFGLLAEIQIEAG
jgi:endonuclease/exonuclease/phosphatase family metal-dependent hydrolase